MRARGQLRLELGLTDAGREGVRLVKGVDRAQQGLAQSREASGVDPHPLGELDNLARLEQLAQGALGFE